MGVCAKIFAERGVGVPSGFLSSARFWSVTKKPGAIALTRIPALAICTAIHCVKLLTAALAALANHYPYVVLDNEAGLENLSRRLVCKVDLLIMVSDPSCRGLETLRRLYALAREMEVDFDRLALVVNRLRHDSLPAEIEAIRAETGAHGVWGLPDHAAVAEIAERGGNVNDLPADNPLDSKVAELLCILVPGGKTEGSHNASFGEHALAV